MDYNETIIKLLGRMVFTEEDVKDVITSNKGSKAKEYIKGFNVCDGTRSLKDIAKIIGVTSGTLSPILKYWEDIGIVYLIKNKKGKFYKKIFSVR